VLFRYSTVMDLINAMFPLNNLIREPIHTTKQFFYFFGVSVRNFCFIVGGKIIGLFGKVDVTLSSWLILWFFALQISSKEYLLTGTIANYSVKKSMKSGFSMFKRSDTKHTGELICNELRIFLTM
jgi:hypothetical protein